MLLNQLKLSLFCPLLILYVSIKSLVSDKMINFTFFIADDYRMTGCVGVLKWFVIKYNRRPDETNEDVETKASGQASCN